MNAKKAVAVCLFALAAMFCATASYGNSYQVWPSTATPAILDVGPDSPVELGVSFKADVSGYITGIRFYKGANNTGTHVGNLWGSTGTLLASATFANETASGWQQVNFSKPVLISANTRYVASYHCNGGHYSVTGAYFATSGADNTPLHALANTNGTPDGPFAYGSTSQFPTNTYNSGNYWVDVVFTPATTVSIWPNTATPAILDVGPDSPVELGVSFKADVSGYITGIRFYKGANNTGTHVGNLWSSTGTLLASATFTNETASGWQQVNFSSPVYINANTAYVASYHAAVGHYSVSGGAFASSGVDNAPLHALINTGSTPNGPFIYGNTSQFPTNTYNSGNYWVDVVFSSAGGASTGSAQLTATPASLSFGNVPVGTKSSAQTITLNNAGTTSLSISQVNVTGSGFAASGVTAPLTLTAGQSASLSVTFAPSAAGSVTGSVSIANSASSSPTTIALSGAGIQAQLAVTPASASFGNVVIGASNSQTFTLTNGGSASVTITQANVTGTGFTLSGLTTPLTIAAGNRATFNAVFTPTAATSSSGSISLVSNAPNSPLGINLGGTGVVATHLMGASPSSLNFGNVNAGSSSSLKVTLTNSGNSNVTISGVNASGSGYSASGVNANTTLTPGQTATVNVTFAPTAAGNAGGSVSVTSNATNSPASISLSGSGVAQSSSGSPTCGKVGDTTNHVPSDWQTFTPPAKGQSYVDPTFGCTVTRITDVSNEVWSGSFYLPVTHGYATVSPFNANDTYLMLADGWNRHFVTDLQGNIVVASGNMPGMNDSWALWDAANASVFYYTNGNSLMKGSISGTSVTASTVHQFSEYAAINFMDETDVSQDGAHVVIIGGDTSGSSAENVFVYNLAANTKGPVYTTSCTGSVNGPNNGCLHKLIQTPDNNVIIQFAGDGSGPEQGNRLWTGGTPLPVLQDSTNHLDAGSDLNGNAVFIESGNGTYTPGFSNPCPSGWGLDVRQIYNTQSSVCLLDNPPAWHVGYRGNAQQPWVGLSFFDQRNPSPEWFDNSSSYTAPNASTWLLYEDEIMAVRIDANNNPNAMYRLARGYSRSDVDFNSTPKASISRDGKYMAFDSNMAYAHSGCPASFQTGTNCIDVYVIKIQ